MPSSRNLGLFFSIFIALSACKTLPDSVVESSQERRYGETIHRYKFKNGLKLIVSERKDSSTFAYQTWFDVGSRSELVNKTGLAHFFEHMMFKGTEKFPEGKFDSMLERSGSQGMNAFTSRDYTAYVQELPEKAFPMIVELESDRMRNLLINEKSFNTERAVVINERRMRVDNSPDGKMFETLYKLAFDKHPYRNPVIGWMPHLESMKMSDAKSFYDRFYRPDHATIVISGSLSGVEAAREIAARYGQIKPAVETANSDYPENLPEVVEPPLTKPRLTSFTIEAPLTKIMIGIRTPEATHADRPAIEQLVSLLFDGNSSRLYRALVETGICAFIYASAGAEHDPSLMMISGTIQPGHTAREVEAVIAREFEKAKNSLASETELKKLRNQLEFSFYSAWAEDMGRAQLIGNAETLYGDYRRTFKKFEEKLGLKSDALQDAARKYLNWESRVTVIGTARGKSS